MHTNFHGNKYFKQRQTRLVFLDLTQFGTTVRRKAFQVFDAFFFFRGIKISDFKIKRRKKTLMCNATNKPRRWKTLIRGRNDSHTIWNRSSSACNIQNFKVCELIKFEGNVRFWRMLTQWYWGRLAILLSRYYKWSFGNCINHKHTSAHK